MTAMRDRLRRVKFIVCDIDGALTDGSIFFDGEGRPFRSFHVRDVTAMTLWRLAGGQCAVISGLGSKAVEAVAETWRLTETHLWVRNKQRVCREMARRHGFDLEELAFLGDDLIDMRVMKAVGLAVAVSDAAPEIREIAHLVTEARGGHGALRELVMRVLEAQGRLEEVLEIYCSREDFLLQ